TEAPANTSSSSLEASVEGQTGAGTEPVAAPGTPIAVPTDLPPMPAGAYTPAETPENLEALFTRILVLASNLDPERLELGRALIPEGSRLSKGLAEDMDEEIKYRAIRRFSLLKSHPMALSQTFTPRGNSVQVIGATPKMLADYSSD